MENCDKNDLMAVIAELRAQNKRLEERIERLERDNERLVKENETLRSENRVLYRRIEALENIRDSGMPAALATSMKNPDLNDNVHAALRDRVFDSESRRRDEF